jgi:hypothetical protein
MSHSFLQRTLVVPYLVNRRREFRRDLSLTTWISSLKIHNFNRPSHYHDDTFRWTCHILQSFFAQSIVRSLNTKNATDTVGSGTAGASYCRSTEIKSKRNIVSWSIASGSASLHSVSTGTEHNYSNLKATQLSSSIHTHPHPVYSTKIRCRKWWPSSQAGTTGMVWTLLRIPMNISVVSKNTLPSVFRMPTSKWIWKSNHSGWWNWAASLIVWLIDCKEWWNTNLCFSVAVLCTNRKRCNNSNGRSNNCIAAHKICMTCIVAFVGSVIHPSVYR